MQQLNKAQVLALFLASTYADITPAQMYQGPATEATVPSDNQIEYDTEIGLENQKLITTSSGTECTSNAECTEDGESCANFQRLGTQARNLCINNLYCGSLGKLNGVIFYAPCWETPAEGGTATSPEAEGDLQTLYDETKGLITKVNANAEPPIDQAGEWDAADNLWVSGAYNYQDGWWIQQIGEGEDETTGKWYETNKPVNNKCLLNIGCDDPDTQCCSTYPDQNNRRCVDKTLDGLSQTIGKVTFTVQCAVDSNIFDEIVPENAQDDLAQSALADAAEAITTFFDNVKNDAKAAFGYDATGDDAKTDEQKNTFDQEWAAKDDERRAKYAEFETSVGYADFDDEAKARFQADLLQWAKDQYTICAESAQSIECRKSEEIKEELEKARGSTAEGAKNYYSAMTDEERLEFDSAYESEAERLTASLAAAWVSTTTIAAGNNGAACGGEGDNKVECTSGCCGTSTRIDANGDALSEVREDICVEDPNGSAVNEALTAVTNIITGGAASDAGFDWTDDGANSLGYSYNHVCDSAVRVMATASAALAAYTLM